MPKILLLLITTLLSGCFSWQPDWHITASSSFGKDTSILSEHARDLFTHADNRELLLLAMQAQQEVIMADPENKEALALLANQNILFGAAYAKDEDEREKAYLEAMTIAAKALYTNPEFRKRIDHGETIWEAVDALESEDLDAMGFWVTALFYWYKDCQGGIGQVLNFRWIGRARQVMERMTVLDPDWGNGMLHFTWGIYYLAIPEAVGGDRKLSAAYFEKAIDTGSNWLQHRWGRGRYFHIKMGNKEACRKDLEWVLAQDIREAGGPYAWRFYIQRDAREILANLESYF